MTDTSNELAADLIAGFVAREPMRIGSLIVTIFGDSIVPRGGVVWLGSLINTLASLGISHRRVRTAVYRLVQDDILANAQQGRRSFYSLTANGRRQFDAATHRIYAEQKQDWDQRWCLVLTGSLEPSGRQALRKELQWMGFGQLASDVMAHPRPDRSRLKRCLQALDCSDSVVTFDAATPGKQNAMGVATLVSHAWDLIGMEQAYAAYLSAFDPLRERIAKHPAISPADAFFVRTFLIHEYRKIILRDPGLPHELLPATWLGHAAYELTRQLYRLIVPAAEQYIDQHFENQYGPLPAPVASFEQRLNA
jgi:phenylacetic acid degradation operon negative regulatory protein